jgi:hypothetical protein
MADNLHNIIDKSYIETVLINRLLTDTVDLIHSTTVVPAIKKLTEAYDILNLNQEILDKFKESRQFCWDKGAIQDLNYIGKELVIYHRKDFNPEKKIYVYNTDIKKLVRMIDLAHHFYNR